MISLSDIKQVAREVGFDACGVARLRPMEAEARELEAWIARGYHAGMDYMTRYIDLRRDPAGLLAGAQSVIVCLMSYKTDRKYAEGIPRIAAYARSGDYHYSIKRRLEALAERLQTLTPESRARCFVDSAPVLEKAWAVEAGLGYIGRNTLLIHPELGSFVLIGTILTTLPLSEYDTPYPENHCGGCHKCVENCPAGALRADGSLVPNGGLDANRCLSYQTIENRQPIPENLLPRLAGRLFGCDSCQDICPHNAAAPIKNHDIFQPIEGIYDQSAEAWLALSNSAFKRRFGHTPLARAGLRKIKQTIEQAIKRAKEG
jgi:epoxyqueuosine reductase